MGRCLLQILFILLFTQGKGEEKESFSPPIPTSDLVGGPPSLAFGMVSVIAGNFCDTETDIVLPGAKPLVLSRSYSSNASLETTTQKYPSTIRPHRLYHGWEFNHQGYLYAGRKGVGKAKVVVMTEPSGAMLRYGKPTGQRSCFTLNPPHETEGLTNCSSAINARTNLKNSEVEIGPNFSSVQARLGSGRWRDYIPATPAKPDKNTLNDFLLRNDHSPDGSRLDYTYAAGYMMTINQFGPGGRFINGLKFCYESDERISVRDYYGVLQATYINEKRKINEGHKNVIYCLNQVKRERAPDISYQYYKSVTHGYPRISHKSLPDDRYVKIIYYKDSDKNSKTTLQSNRVSELWAPVGPTKEAIKAAHFAYRKDSTLAYDANDNPTEYFYKDNRITSVVKRYRRGRDTCPIYRENFTWGHKSEETNLLCHTIADSNNQAVKSTSYSYDDRGNVIAKTLGGVITSPKKVERAITRYEYSKDRRNLLLKEREPSGKETLYSYWPGTDLLASKKVSNGKTIQKREFYFYDDNAALSKKISDDGSGEAVDDLTDVTVRKILTLKACTKRNGLGLPEEIIDSYLDGNQERQLRRTVRTYDNFGQILSEAVYDADNLFAYEKEYAYNAYGQVILERDPMGYETRREYDANGNLLRVEGPRPGTYESYTYDFSNRLISETVGDAKSAHTKKHRYNTLSQRVATIDTSGNETTFSFDVLGRLTGTVHPITYTLDGEELRAAEKINYDTLGYPIKTTKANGEVTTALYNCLGQPLAIHYPEGTEEIMEYYLDGTLKSRLNRDGSKVLFTNDPLGHPVKEEWIASDGAFDHAVTYRYKGDLLLEKMDGEGVSTFYEYDGAGRQTHEKVGNESIRYEYDALGRQSRTIQGVGDEAVVYVKEYDLMDRVIEERVEDAFGTLQRLIQYAYDAASNCVCKTEYRENGPSISLTEYDVLNHVTQVTDAIGNTTFTDYDYHCLNEYGQNVLCVTTLDPMGQKTRLTYDARGRKAVQEVFDPYGNRIAKRAHQYDCEGQLTRTNEYVIIPGQRDAYPVTTLWQYGPEGRLEKLTQAAGTADQKIVNYRYNSLGQQIATERSDGTTITNLYDGLGRLSQLVSSDGTVHYSYTYDLSGRLLQATDELTGISTRRSYDAAGRVVSETQGSGLTIAYDYDSQGRKIGVRLPDASAIIYNYRGGDLAAVRRQDAQGRQIYCHNFDAYALDGSLLESRGLGDSLRYHWDALGRHAGFDSSNYSEMVTPEDYDAVSNILGVTLKDPLGKLRCDYLYDALYQLIGEEGVASHSYLRDSVHNCRCKDGTPHTVNDLFQLLSDGATDYTYDANGNRLTDGTKIITYDALDRVTAIKTTDRAVDYSYDAFNRRLSKRVTHGDENEVTLFLYDDQNEIGASLALELKGEIYQPIHNFRGDIAVILGADNKVKGSYRYTAFGEEITHTPTHYWFWEDDTAHQNPWRFQSKRQDPETGLIAFGRRYYDPKTATWLSPDPMGYEAGPNLYAYCDNRPLTLHDLYGLKARSRMDEEPIKEALMQETMALYHSGEDISVYLQSWAVQNKETFADETHSRNGFIGVSHSDPYQRVTYVNGVMTPYSSLLSSAAYLSAVHGGKRIHYTYNGSHGALDIVDCLREQCGEVTHAAKALAKQWIALDKEMGGKGRICHYAHSEGALITNRALDYLYRRRHKEVLNSILEIYSFGAAQMVTNSQIKHIKNYVHYRDPIPGVPDNIQRKTNSDLVEFVGERGPRSLKYHYFFSEGYREVMKDRGKIFLKREQGVF